MDLSSYSPSSSLNSKHSLIAYLLGQAELHLLKGNLPLGLNLFEKAHDLDPQNAKIFYREGVALFEYGSAQKNKKLFFYLGKNLNKQPL